MNCTPGIVGRFFLCNNSPVTKKEKEHLFNRVLFRWHKSHYRDMPWRHTHDPYRILVSEVMLQQTGVDRVREKYAAFLKAFPTVHILADASLGDVLRVWSGLGYNRRAKYLHECAKEVVRMHGGKFPRDEGDLKKLPGIGPSTAAALSSFAFAGNAPMIDTNIRRILVRVFFKKEVPSDRELYIFAKGLIRRGKGRVWNYAMLDVGAMLCTARNHSNECPFVALHGTVGDFAHKKPQTKFTDSRRFYRGKILQLLAKEKEVSRTILIRSIGIKIPEMTEILHDLKKEGLIVMARGKIILPT